MTRQALAGQPITVIARSQVGGVVPDTELTVDGGTVYSNPDCTDQHDELRANGAGEFVFFAEPGSVLTVNFSDPLAVPVEPIQVVGTALRPGGVAAVHPSDTPDVHADSPLSEVVSDASLVGAPPPGATLPEEDGGALASVRIADNQVIEPGPDADQPTPDGTTATDPDAVAPPSEQEEQVTPQYEPVPEPGATELQPEQVTEVDPPQPAADAVEGDVEES